MLYLDVLPNKTEGILAEGVRRHQCDPIAVALVALLESSFRLFPPLSVFSLREHLEVALIAPNFPILAVFFFERLGNNIILKDCKDQPLAVLPASSAQQVTVPYIVVWVPNFLKAIRHTGGEPTPGWVL